MVQLDKLYTRGGDDGETSLGDGTRVSKSSHRIGAYGEVDELNALLALCLDNERDHDGKERLGRLQNELFDLGADLCVPLSERKALRVTDAAVSRLEQEIDALNEELPPLKSFVLPGGNPLATAYHMARTVCRRVERRLVELQEDEGAERLNPAAMAYVNRLSDLLFVLARRAAGGEERLWRPGGDDHAGGGDP